MKVVRLGRATKSSPLSGTYVGTCRNCNSKLVAQAEELERGQLFEEYGYAACPVCGENRVTFRHWTNCLYTALPVIAVLATFVAMLVTSR